MSDKKQDPFFDDDRKFAIAMMFVGWLIGATPTILNALAEAAKRLAQ